MSVTKRFELVEGTSSKFWEISLEGNCVTTRYGKLGTAGQSTTKDEGSPEKAQKLHDKLVREKTGKGYVEQSGAEAAAAVAPKPAKKAEPVPAPSKKEKAAAAETKTFSDVRRLALESVPETNFRDERIVDAIVLWSHETEDDELVSWLGSFPAEEGWRSHVAGRLAVARELDGNRTSAMSFLERAEAALPPEDAAFGHVNALIGLLPARWRLAPQKAERGLESVRAYFSKWGYPDDALYGMAALGGQDTRVDELLPTLSFRSQDSLRALPALLAGESNGRAGALVRAHFEANPGDDTVSRELLRECLRLGRPESYLELVLGAMDVLEDSTPLAAHLRSAVKSLERKSPALAASFARRLLDASGTRDWGGGFLLRCVHAQSPADAAAWAAERKKLMAEELVALGRGEEARPLVEALVASNDPKVLDIAELTNDRELAIRVLKARCETEPAWNCAWDHARLVALGERAYVEERLAGGLTELGALPAKKRDSACRDFAKDAGALGRMDLAEKSYKLASAGARPYVALTCAEGCAEAGQWGGVLTALAYAKTLRPDSPFEDVMGSAIVVALRTSVDSIANWP